MIPHERFGRLLELAEAARTDQSLLPNHLGTVDRDLSHERAEISSLLSLLEGDESESEFKASLAAKLSAIDHALTAYAH